jgi:hypothetical protein
MAKSSNVSGIVSLRLTPEERRLVEEAAAKKGWKVAHFLRVSALERAAHILNLSRPTSFDFGGVARRVAEGLMAERHVDIYTTTQDRIGRFGVGILDYRTIEKSPGRNADLSEIELRAIGPEPLTRDEMDKVFHAVRLGGLDFAEQLLTECRRLVTDTVDPSLPPPIDPSNLKEGDVE